jgi:hypothetical protein
MIYYLQLCFEVARRDSFVQAAHDVRTLVSRHESAARIGFFVI